MVQAANLHSILQPCSCMEQLCTRTWSSSSAGGLQSCLLQVLSMLWFAQVLEAKVGWAAWALEQGVVQAADLARTGAPAHGEAVGEAAV